MNQPLHDDIRRRLGYQSLNRTWAKAEIFLGLTAAGVGLFLGTPALMVDPFAWHQFAAGLALFVLGGYLAMAGHRSHLYQADSRYLAVLIEEMRQLHSKGSTP